MKKVLAFLPAGSAVCRCAGSAARCGAGKRSSAERRRGVAVVTSHIGWPTPSRLSMAVGGSAYVTKPKQVPSRPGNRRNVESKWERRHLGQAYALSLPSSSFR